MSGHASGAAKVPWWKEPTKDQWYAYFAAWMGWTLDAFDFTVFLLIIAPIAQEFGVPIIEVTAVFSVTLVMRLRVFCPLRARARIREGRVGGRAYRQTAGRTARSRG